MYTRLDQRRVTTGIAGTRAHELPADRHSGTCADFLRRHECEASRAAHGTRTAREQFAHKLFARAVDTRNIRLALEHLRTEGGQAPGPNGFRLDDLDPLDDGGLYRTISAAMTAEYVPGPTRKARFLKYNGESRTISMSNVEDRIVGRAIVQVVQPLVDPQFSPRSFGFRPGKGRDLAIATAEILARHGNQSIWCGDDIRQAFDKIPRSRLLDIVRTYLPDDNLLDLISRCCRKRENIGILQGNPLSPLLLNIYLDHLLDKWWDRLMIRSRAYYHNAFARLFARSWTRQPEWE